MRFLYLFSISLNPFNSTKLYSVIDQSVSQNDSTIFSQSYKPNPQGIFLPPYQSQAPNNLTIQMSTSLVPLTVYKGAGYEHIPFNTSSPTPTHITADFHSIRTKTEAPAYVTSGFYKVEAGPTLSAHYGFEEAKYVLSGQIDVYVSFPRCLPWHCLRLLDQ